MWQDTTQSMKTKHNRAKQRETSVPRKSMQSKRTYFDCSVLWLYCNYPWRAVQHPASSILGLKRKRSKKVCLHRPFRSNFRRIANRLCKLAGMSRRFVAVKSPPLRACGNLMCFFASGKLPTHPSPKPTLTLTSHLEQIVSLGEG